MSNQECNELCKCIGCQNNNFYKNTFHIDGGNHEINKKDNTTEFLIDNNFSWILGGNFDMKQKDINEFYEGLY